MESAPLMSRFRLIGLSSSGRYAKFARDVAEGLTASPKYLSCCYFYDGSGSLIFEAICSLPEYYLTRAEMEILAQHSDEIVGMAPPASALVELGSGSATKTRLLIESFLRRRPTLRYIPIDICRTMLAHSSQQLLQAYPALEILAVAGEYREALDYMHAGEEYSKLVLWLGSNIGNFERHDAAHFLSEVRRSLLAEDRLLIGIDLRKSPSKLLAAYDDARGVTAAFNRNLLVRINRELGGHFDPTSFRHCARYDEEKGRIEMYLVSERLQQVAIDRLELVISFDAEEPIHTENSYKYSRREIQTLGSAAGLTLLNQWFDNQHQFSLNLFAPQN